MFFKKAQQIAKQEKPVEDKTIAQLTEIPEPKDIEVYTEPVIEQIKESVNPMTLPSLESGENEVGEVLEESSEEDEEIRKLQEAIEKKKQEKLLRLEQEEKLKQMQSNPNLNLELALNNLNDRITKIEALLFRSSQ